MDLPIDQDTGAGGTIRFPITAIKARPIVLTDITITTIRIIAGIQTHIATIGIPTIAPIGGTGNLKERRSYGLGSPQLFFCQTGKPYRFISLSAFLSL